jgi:Ca-activated chloride channel family protein
MSFATPFVLWGLLLIPLGLVAYWLVQRRQIKYAARFTNLDLLVNVVDATPGRRRHLPALFALAALAALIAAMARPQMVVAVPREDATVVLTMDTSASMKATDVAPSRLDAAKSAATTFLDQVPDRFRVGLVSFSSAVRVLEEPTDDREAVRSSLESLQGDIGTALGDAIEASVALADDPEATEDNVGEKPLFAVLLLSDGANTTGSEPLAVVDEAKEAGVPIYTIALGTPNGTVDVTDDYGQV